MVRLDAIHLGTCADMLHRVMYRQPREHYRVKVGALALSAAEINIASSMMHSVWNDLFVRTAVQANRQQLSCKCGLLSWMSMPRAIFSYNEHKATLLLYISQATCSKEVRPHNGMSPIT
jgi:hypothetical protein